MASRSKKKPRKRKPAGNAGRMTSFIDSVLAGVISGLMVLALQKLFPADASYLPTRNWRYLACSLSILNYGEDFF